jgi:hypothetical protein
VKTWLDANLNEGLSFATYDAISYINSPPQVLTLLIVNINNLPPTAFDSVFQAVGLATISYRPTTANQTIYDYPTLGSMIDTDLRLVTFLDNGADFTSVPYIIDGTHVSPKPVKIFILTMCLQSFQTCRRLSLMLPIKQISIALQTGQKEILLTIWF